MMKYLTCCQHHQKWTEKANCYQTSLVILFLKVILQEHQNQSEKKPVPAPRKLKGAVPPVHTNFKMSESIVKQFTLSSLIQETHEDIKPLPNIKCVEKPNFVSLPESEDNEEEEEVDEVEKVELDYDELKSFLKRQETPIDYKHAEIFDMATIGLYSKKYK